MRITHFSAARGILIPQPVLFSPMSPFPHYPSLECQWLLCSVYIIRPVGLSNYFLLPSVCSSALVGFFSLHFSPFRGKFKARCVAFNSLQPIESEATDCSSLWNLSLLNTQLITLSYSLSLIHVKWNFMWYTCKCLCISCWEGTMPTPYSHIPAGKLWLLGAKHPFAPWARKGKLSLAESIYVTKPTMVTREVPARLLKDFLSHLSICLITAIAKTVNSWRTCQYILIEYIERTEQNHSSWPFP